MNLEITLYVDGHLADRETREQPASLATLEQCMSEIGPRHEALTAGRNWYTDFSFSQGDEHVKTWRVSPAPSGDRYFVAAVDPGAPPIGVSVPQLWTNEASGRVRPVVEKYLRGHILTPKELAIMRLYLKQWIMSEAWAGGPQLDELRKQVPLIQSTLALKIWLEHALEINIDPL